MHAHPAARSSCSRLIARHTCFFLVAALQVEAKLTVQDLRIRAKRSRVNVEDLDNQLALSGYVVRRGACTSHTLAVGVLTQIKCDSRWGEVRMIAPGQVKLNWVSTSPRPPPT